MKTKTYSFTKVINFCVLALFLITNMIFFTSCDNGNSPNDNTNEEQNNTQNTDYCEICDGLQTENCGIKHKCDDENCVEYSDNKIYKNGHTHDYCERTDCDGSTHMGADHPTEPTYPDWFKKITIGGEDSPYKVFVIDNNAYNKTHDFTAESKVNDYLDKYIEHINGLTLNKELTGDVEIPTTAIKNMVGDNAEWRFDALIGTTSKNEISTNTIGINDVCKPAIEEIAKNVAITNEEFDLDYFYLNFRAFENEAYGLANDKNSKTYTEKKAEIEKDLDSNNKHYNIDYSIYKEDGTIHPNALQRFDEAIKAATTKLKKQGKNVTEDDLRNIIKLSLTASSIEGMHDYLSSTLLVNEHEHTDECYNNEMVDAIYGVDYEEMTPVAQAKLNKSIFSQDYGRELV